VVKATASTDAFMSRTAPCAKKSGKSRMSRVAQRQQLARQPLTFGHGRFPLIEQVEDVEMKRGARRFALGHDKYLVCIGGLSFQAL
jgi:hypothetical protein